MTVLLPSDCSIAQVIADTDAHGAKLRAGVYLDDWDEGVHPYGKPDPCPFCRSPQDWTILIYNGPGAPPSYIFSCGSCGAQGPHSHGFERGDHWNARVDAIDQWNSYKPRRFPLRLSLRRRFARLLREIANWLQASA